MQASVCRSLATDAPCTEIYNRKIAPGEAVAIEDTLPADLQNGSPRTLRYRVQVSNPEGHNAGWSRDAITVAGTAPESLTGLRSVTTGRGLQVSWSPAQVEGDERILLEVTSVVGRPTRILTVSARVNGAIDPSAPISTPLHYKVFRSRPVQIAGRTYTINGAPSTIDATRTPDTFPPPTPTGLVVIAEDLDSKKPQMDLSWNPVIASDLRGYIVYRREVLANDALGPERRLTAEPIPRISFADTEAMPGHTYSYSVSSIDLAGNESVPSSQARAQAE